MHLDYRLETSNCMLEVTYLIIRRPASKMASTLGLSSSLSQVSQHHFEATVGFEPVGNIRAVLSGPQSRHLIAEA